MPKEVKKHKKVVLWDLQEDKKVLREEGQEFLVMWARQATTLCHLCQDIDDQGLSLRPLWCERGDTGVQEGRPFVYTLDPSVFTLSEQDDLCQLLGYHPEEDDGDQAWITSKLSGEGQGSRHPAEKRGQHPLSLEGQPLWAPSSLRPGAPTAPDPPARVIDCPVLPRPEGLRAFQQQEGHLFTSAA